MSIHVSLNHKTHYRYDRRINLGPQVVRLRPAPHCRTPILAYSLKIAPATHFINWQQDPQANYLARLVFPEPTNEFSVEVDLVAEMAVFNPFDFFLEPSAENYPFTYDAALARELRPYLETEPAGSAPRRLAQHKSRAKNSAPSTSSSTSTSACKAKSATSSAWSPASRPARKRSALRTGSCRDSAWLLVQILRHLGLAARFVSGYLIQLAPDVKPLEGPAGPTSDFTDLHAWTEVYLPGAGWVGLDPTSGLLAGEGHIPLACTPDASSAAPISGAARSLRDRVRARDDRRSASSNRRASPSPTASSSGSRSKPSAIASTNTSKRETSASPWAASPLSFPSTTPMAPSGPSAPSAPTNAGSPSICFSSCATVSPPARSAFRTRQVVSRRAAAALGARLLLAQRWRADLGRPDASSPKTAEDYKYNAADARRFIEALTRRLEVDPQFIMTGL